MPETKRKVLLPPPMGLTEGVDVPVKEATERWSEITLTDGTVLRVKPNVMHVTRIDGQYDAEGNPMYALFSNQVMTISNVPAHLRKPVVPAAGVKAN